MINLDGEWADLAAMLRREIEGYGRLFAVLEGQRTHLLQQDLEGILQANCDLEAQADILNDFRVERIGFVETLCREHAVACSEKGWTVRGLVAIAPSEAQAMFESIIKEVERLILETSRYLKRNQMLLRRAHDIGHNFLKILNPNVSDGAAYKRNGFASGAARGAVASSYLKRA